ncbi:MAG: NRDE family protein [bacterium]|nr:NRDE family protein [bacterium]
MCTMSWVFDTDGYDLFFNRDELVTRKTAYPPEIRSETGVRYIVPIDADAGGTWMGVNQFGTTVALMNSYGQAVQDGPFVSRGLLVLSLLDCSGQGVVVERLAQMRLTDYRPFTIAVFEPGRNVAICRWDGRTSQFQEDVAPPLMSSSFRESAVADHRVALFEALKEVNPTSLRAYHSGHIPEAGAYSVCMHRDDARTMSLSWVRVNREQVSFFYAPGAPCQTDFLPPVSLMRRCK